MTNKTPENYDAKLISEQLEKLRSKGCTNNTFEEILNSLIPINNNYQVKGVIKNVPGETAFFNPIEKTIFISPVGFESLVKKMLNATTVANHLSVEELNELARYYILFVFLHEIGHVNQQLIQDKYIEFPYKTVVEAYKNIQSPTKTILEAYNNLECFQINITTFPILFKMLLCNYKNQKDKPSFLLERNASIEAYDKLVQTARYELSSKIFRILRAQLSYILTYGYKGIYNGSVEESYSKTWQRSLYKQLPQNEDIPTEDRIRYGLPIDKETRNKVLKREFKFTYK